MTERKSERVTERVTEREREREREDKTDFVANLNMKLTLLNLSEFR